MYKYVRLFEHLRQLKGSLCFACICCRSSSSASSRCSVSTVVLLRDCLDDTRRPTSSSPRLRMLSIVESDIERLLSPYMTSCSLLSRSTSSSSSFWGRLLLPCGGYVSRRSKAERGYFLTSNETSLPRRAGSGGLLPGLGFLPDSPLLLLKLPPRKFLLDFTSSSVGGDSGDAMPSSES